MRAYEDWASRVAGRRGAAPRLVLVAREDDQIAGALVGRIGTGADPMAGSIEELGVRRPWRWRGLGLALLHVAFDGFARRGLMRSVLTVDSENPHRRDAPVRACRDARGARLGSLGERAPARVTGCAVAATDEGVHLQRRSLISVRSEPREGTHNTCITSRRHSKVLSGTQRH